MKIILCVFFFALFFIPMTSFGKGNEKLIISISEGNSQAFYDREISSKESHIFLSPKEDFYYYGVSCPSQPTQVSTKKLSDTIEIEKNGKGTYIVKATLLRIVGFHEEEQSITIPGSYFLEMCQVYKPKIMTQENSWEFYPGENSGNFVRTLNGKTIKIERR